jgi:Tol biopolymer transport system component
MFFLPLIVVLVSVSVMLNLRHVKAAEDYSARVMTDTGALMKTQPAISGSRIAFTMLQSPVYTIGVLSRNKLSKFETDTDVFHPAFIPGSSEAFVELAGKESKIVRVDFDVPEAIHEKLQIVVANGEQPVVSPDGQWLAFIRETRGRGALWIKPLHPVETQKTALTNERELVGSEYDVLEASFDSESREIAFSAQPKGRILGQSLYKTGLSPSTITPIPVDSAVRYPAFSGDGMWMAYSRLERGSWQIWIKPLPPGKERQITSGECNSIYPAWMPDSKELVYATDCGRGWSMTSLARVRIAP